MSPSILWLIAAAAYLLHLVTIPARQRASHPATLIGGANLAMILEGPWLEHRSLSWGQRDSILLHREFLDPAMLLALLAYLALLLGCRYRGIHDPEKTGEHWPEPTNRGTHVLWLAAAITILLNVYMWFWLFNLAPVLIRFQGGRGGVIRAFTPPITTFNTAVTIATSLVTMLTLIWLWTRALSLHRRPVLALWVSAIPLVAGLASMTRGLLLTVVGAPVLVYLLVRPRVSVPRFVFLTGLILLGVLIAGTSRQSEQGGVAGVISWLANAEPEQVFGDEQIAGALGGSVPQLTSCFYLTDLRGHVGVGHALAQLNPLPSFLAGDIGNYLWFQEALGISAESVGITVPVLCDLYLDIGWLALLPMSLLGVFLNWTYRRTRLALARGEHRNQVFPTWVVFYVLCLFGFLAMWHQSTRGLYRTVFNSALLCIFLSAALNRRHRRAVVGTPAPSDVVRART